MTMNTGIISLTLLALSLCFAADTAADSITLRASVRAPHDRQTITLGDIARLDGPEAVRHDSLVIATIDKSGRIQTLRLDDIRSALESAEVNWAKVSLNGRDVMVRPRVEHGAHGPKAMEPQAITTSTSRKGEQASEPVPVVAESIMKEGTLRSAIAALMASGLGLDPSNLQMVFDPRDHDLLALNDPALRFQIDPISSLRSDRTAFSIVVWRGAEIDRKATIAVQPYIAVRAADVARDIQRGETITPNDLTVRTSWVRPSFLDRVADPEASGRVATRALEVGTTLTQRDLASETVVRRGDRTLIRCLSGGIVINFEAEARENGAVGDRIEFRKVGERETFLAVVAAGGEAVLDLRRQP